MFILAMFSEYLQSINRAATFNHSLLRPVTDMVKALRFEGAIKEKKKTFYRIQLLVNYFFLLCMALDTDIVDIFQLACLNLQVLTGG